MNSSDDTTVGQVAGRIYRGSFPATFCFVPNSCVVNGQLNEAAYIRSGWGTRNARLNANRVAGSHLLPAGVTESDAVEAPPGFLEKLRTT